jgi:hypothetical protein
MFGLPNYQLEIRTINSSGIDFLCSILLSFMRRLTYLELVWLSIDLTQLSLHGDLAFAKLSIGNTYDQQLQYLVFFVQLYSAL